MTRLAEIEVRPNRRAIPTGRRQKQSARKGVGRKPKAGILILLPSLSCSRWETMQYGFHRTEATELLKKRGASEPNPIKAIFARFGRRHSGFIASAVYFPRRPDLIHSKQEPLQLRYTCQKANT